MKLEDPPKSRKGMGKVDWDEVVDLAVKNKGQWLLVGEFSPGIAYHIRVGAYKQFFMGKTPTEPETFMRRNWEIAARVAQRGSQRINLYIRKMP